MFKIPPSLEWKLYDLKQEAEKAAQNITQEAKIQLSRIKTEAEIKYPEIVNRVEESLDTVKGTLNEIIIEDKLGIFKNNKKMEHKIIMLGGRRAGKSTILASILNLLRGETPGSICTITDLTDYDQEFLGNNDDKMHRIPTLTNKQREAAGYIKRITKPMFLVDMTPTVGEPTYTLQVASKGNVINLEFVDVPGEWMRQTAKENIRLQELIKQSDVFVIAIDTPYLMQEGIKYDNEVNDVYNRISEIISVLNGNIRIEAENVDKKLILLCPVKCEKWMYNGTINKVSEKVKYVYKDLINRWKSGKIAEDFDIRIMPLNTVGGLESYKLLPALRYYKDKNDITGISCSEKENEHVLVTAEGNTLRIQPDSYLEIDSFWLIDHTQIPLSWYKANGKGYSPLFCEQPGYHILRFLVNKEENVIIKTAESQREKLAKMNILWRYVTKIFKPTFGEYLPVWREVINGLTSTGLIKESGDGFMNIKEIIDDKQKEHD